MLLSLRDRVKGSKVLRTTLIVIIAIPFALFGIGSYLGGGGNYSAATVNDEEISIQTYEQNYFLQRNQLRAAFGGSIPAGFDSAGLLRNQALETSITQALLLQHTSESGYAVGDDAVAAAIVRESAFHEDEKFSKERYEAQLQSLGMSAQQFEEQLRQDLSINQMREGVVFTAFKTASDATREAALRNQTRTFAELVITPESAQNVSEPDEESIKKYFTDHQARFRHPESVKLAYIELEQTALADRVTIDEEAMLGMYEENQANYMTPERRRASHILLTVDDSSGDEERADKRTLLESLRTRITGGESFSDLAQEFSEDPGSAAQGGDLGAFPRGAMVPEFENAAFTLQEGEISDVVESPFGLHLIQLNEIIPGEGKSYEQALPEIEQALRSRESEGLFFELSDSLANEVYENSDTLETASTVVDVDVVETDWLEAGSNSDIFRYPAVRQAAFNEELLEENINSELIEVGNNHVIVIRVLEHRPESARELSEVRSDIIASLKSDARDEALKSTAEQALNELKGGRQMNDVAAQHSGSLVNDAVTVGRNDASVDANTLSEVFKMAKPQGASVYSVVKTLTGAYAVVELVSVNDSTGSDVIVQEDNLRQSQSLGQAEYSAWLASMRGRATVVINNQLLEEVSAQRQ